MRNLVVLSVAALVACSPSPTSTTQTATLRNDPPATCTTDQQKACAAPDVTACAGGTQPVIDYSSDCCAHFSCQPTCQAAKPCTRSPAPVCPAGTNLWIGTAVEDCCPAYRCEPDISCDGKTVACTLAMPYCGNGVQPVAVGKTADCCPIYQCPCDMPGDPTKPQDVKMCGCTFPNCKPGEEVVCAGMDPCGGPCKCAPAHGTCTTDSECPADARCDISTCRLPPTAPAEPPQCDPTKCGPKPGMPNMMCADGKNMSGPTGRCLMLDPKGSCGWEIAACPAPAPTCDPLKCGPQLGMLNKLCPDGKTLSGPTGRCLATDGRCAWEVLECPPVGCDPMQCGPQLGMPNKLCADGVTLAGPTGRCLPGPDGKCGWEVLSCTTSNCFGVCVPNIKSGCTSDTDCPSGQKCDVACSGWGCASDPSGTSACACPKGDPSCKCDPTTGVCSGQSCTGQCVPAVPGCDPSKAVCPASIPACPDGQTPVIVDKDPTTCCPVYQCPSCGGKGGNPIACPMVDCVCAVLTGTDPTTCCPTYQCGKVDANGKCL